MAENLARNCEAAARRHPRMALNGAWLWRCHVLLSSFYRLRRGCTTTTPHEIEQYTPLTTHSSFNITLCLYWGFSFYVYDYNYSSRCLIIENKLKLYISDIHAYIEIRGNPSIIHHWTNSRKLTFFLVMYAEHQYAYIYQFRI